MGRLKQKTVNGCQSEHGEPVIRKLRLRRAVKIRNRFVCFVRVRFDLCVGEDTLTPCHRSEHWTHPIVLFLLLRSGVFLCLSVHRLYVWPRTWPSTCSGYSAGQLYCQLQVIKIFTVLFIAHSGAHSCLWHLWQSAFCVKANGQNINSVIILSRRL